MPALEIIICEARPRWRPELERQFVGEAVRVRSCRSPLEVSPTVDATPPIVVIQLESALAETLQWLGRRTGHGNRWPVIVISSERTADLEWPLRELGALTVLPDNVSGDDLANLCRRQWGLPLPPVIR